VCARVCVCVCVRAPSVCVVGTIDDIGIWLCDIGRGVTTRRRAEHNTRRQHLAWTIYFSGRPSAGSSSGSSSSRSRSRRYGGSGACRGRVVHLTYYIPITRRVSRRWMLGSYIMCKHARNFRQIGWYIFTPSPLQILVCDENNHSDTLSRPRTG
jgi:hypothetical protein